MPSAACLDFRALPSVRLAEDWRLREAWRSLVAACAKGLARSATELGGVTKKPTR